MLPTILTLVIIKLAIASHSPLNLQETDDFQTLRLHNDLFIDKSLLIEEFLEHMENYSIPVLIRPEGWGKSTNADMLRRFFEIEVDSKGERLPKENLTNPKLFLGGDFVISPTQMKNLTPLKITNSTKAMEHMGNYPVILVKMKNAIGHTSPELEKNVKICITEVYKNHRYLFHSSKITDKEKFSNYSNGIFNTPLDLGLSLFFLSQKLYEHFDSKVHIIIDDYDVPSVNAQLTFSRDLLLMDKFQVLMRRIYEGAFKVNIYLGVGLVNGILPGVKSQVFVVPSYPIFALAERRPPFVEHYGFTRQEVQEILSKVPIKPDLDEISSWYGGYLVFGPQEFFNIRSLLRCLAHNGTLQYYGSNSNYTSLVESVILLYDKQSQIQALVHGGFVPNYYFSFADRITTSWGTTLPEFRTLFLTGYLRADPTLPMRPSTIPNQEIKYFYETVILKWVCNKFCITPDQFRSFVGLLLAGQIYQFRQTLEEHLKVADNFNPFNAKSTPEFYGHLMIAIRNALSATHSVHLPEKEANKINETILIPRQDRNDAAVVITYKIIDREEDLIPTAKSGLWEIYMRPYAEQWKTYPYIQKIIRLSMAFRYQKVDLQCSIEKFKV